MRCLRAFTGGVLHHPKHVSLIDTLDSLPHWIAYWAVGTPLWILLTQYWILIFFQGGTKRPSLIVERYWICSRICSPSAQRYFRRTDTGWTTTSRRLGNADMSLPAHCAHSTPCPIGSRRNLPTMSHTKKSAFGRTWKTSSTTSTRSAQSILWRDRGGLKR